MSGRTDSDTEPVIATDTQTARAAEAAEGTADAVVGADARDTRDTVEAGLGEDGEDGEAGRDGEEYVGDARRARWIAVGTGALLTLAGLAAALFRAAGSAPALASAAYALGAAVCAAATVLGSRGRTRRALWLLIAGTMIMAFGDQFD
ncbi:hypothetical protein JK361_34820 [Streptomyces sp. 5-8]|uniref:Uncharacterized protein n=1 Tax=Streptomyces musisoli TaxID=2802280 RepID=A0ABS1PBX3_9ACTN|nr:MULTISPECIES: hypothetical protein [Streptomyces]MBL1109695.1 hypothetical protein [Streptomyces musisoli]MBY8844926.1 hypothetical protein [Streptomyces sp. SP2-10]